MSDTVPEASADPSTVPAAPKKEHHGSAIWREIKGLLWVLLAVLLFHSFVAKPFYIPSESMMPSLLKGDRLVVSKYPYGWSWVSPSFHIFPHWQGRLLGNMPDRGDIVIVTPPGQSDDYIKRPGPERWRRLCAGQGSSRPSVPDGRQSRPQRR